MAVKGETESRLDRALALSKHGYIPIPICAGGKHIAFDAMSLVAYHAATRRKRFKDMAFQSLAFGLAMRPPGEADIRAWFSSHRGNIGIVSGHRQLIVLDFDQPAVFHRWTQSYPSLSRETPIERTPHGFHVYLACDEPTESSSLYLGRRKAGHLSGIGGYVVCSPSLVEGGRYEWLPGQSFSDLEPARMTDLAGASLFRSGWAKRHYDRLLRHGLYVPDEEMRPKVEE
jgi:hypothetical protein